LWRARSQQAASGHNHAPLPGIPEPGTTAPLSVHTTRTNPPAGARRRQPMQVRSGAMRRPPRWPAAS
jgi:hypothetical protein